MKSKQELLKQTTYGFDDLVAIMEILRSEGGCPWDREQTHESIRKNFIEETYEVVDAIDHKDTAGLREELGDVLMQVVFHARMEEEIGSFTIDDVCREVCEKLIIRHPHVFSDTVADDSATVLKNWEEIKNKTKGIEKQSESLMAVPEALPALMRAQKIQHRAAKIGFDFPDADAALQKLEEEITEVRQADEAHKKEEIGDVLFSAVNFARLSGYDAEECLYFSNEKFVSRFKAMESLASIRGIDLKQANLAGLDRLWEEAKQQGL